MRETKDQTIERLRKQLDEANKIIKELKTQTKSNHPQLSDSDMDRIMVDKDDEIRELKKENSHIRKLCAKKVADEVAKRTEAEVRIDELERQVISKEPDSQIKGVGDSDYNVLRKYKRGDLLMGSIDMITPWEELAFFNTKDLIIRIHPKTGRQLSSKDISTIKEYLRENHYYETLLDKLYEVTTKANSLEVEGLDLSNRDTMEIIDKAHHLGLVLLGQYIKLFE